MGADDRMEDGRPVAVFLVEQRGSLPAATVSERALAALEELLQPLRQPLVRRVHAGEERVAARVRYGQRVELGRLEWLLVVRAVGVPTFGAASIDGHVERAVRPELVDAQQGDLRMVGVPRALRRVRVHDAEAAAVAQEVVDLELLARHHDDVVVEPRPIDAGELRVVERLDVDALDLGADLWPQAAYLHGRAILTSRATLSRAPAPVVRCPPSRRARRAERRSSGPSYGRPRARRLAPRPRAHGSGSARRASTTRTPGAPSRARWPRAASRPGAHAPGPAGPASPGASPSRPRARRPRGAGPRLRRSGARLAPPRLVRSGAGCRPAPPSTRPWPSSACRAALRDDRHPAARQQRRRCARLRARARRRAGPPTGGSAPTGTPYRRARASPRPPSGHARARSATGSWRARTPSRSARRSPWGDR